MVDMDWQAVAFWLQKSSPSVPRPTGWSAVENLIALHSSVVEIEVSRLRRRLEESRPRFSPLEDPLACNFTENAWLSEEREESYSSWLHWVLAQFGTWSRVSRILGVQSGENDGRAVTLGREDCVDYEGEGGRGRLDITIWAGEEQLCVIEVKTRTFEQENLDKQRSYCASPDVQASSAKVFLAIEYDGEEDLHGFTFRSWADVCLSLRQMAGQIDALLTRAMILCFVSAVEQNILGLTTLGSAARGQVAKTVAHLDRFMEEFPCESKS